MMEKKKLKILIFDLKQMICIDLASKEKESEMVKWRVLRATSPIYIYWSFCHMEHSDPKRNVSISGIQLSIPEKRKYSINCSK